MESSNPTLNGRIFAKARATLGSGSTMTVSGTVNKTMILLAIVIALAFWGFTSMPTWMAAINLNAVLMGVSIAGLVMALLTTFKPQFSPVTAPIYAAIQGVFIGVLSFIFEIKYPGIVVKAVALTFGALFSMLFLYKAGLIRATSGFKKGIMIATSAIGLFYILVMVVSLFGVAPPGFINGATPLGIFFSLFVVTIATLSFIVNFDFIERASEEGLEPYMEWYGAFGLIVTLIWLYLEILRLLSKLSSRD